ncbi:uncharacterized protein C19orf44 homolog [Lates calcarifer]|uniref:Uncharacterized protein C19orf44 homolog n=1 Tax=Lates calcarifer TaxID=8187 RepID=A0A4W6F0X2_LATCA|nr:uncharacterized protein C19orf44 homolog [Lates calcarifer]
MWKRGGRSSALDRAQALLSAKRNSGENVGSTAPTTRAHTGAVDGSMKTRSAPPNTHTLFSDLSDLSSVSSASENRADSAAPEKSQGREGGSTKDLRPQNSLGGGGGGSRFLKKAPPPATNSSQTQMQQISQPRYVSSSQYGSQTAAMSRLAQIESRIRSWKQALEQAGQGISPPPGAASQSLEASMPASAQSSSDQSLKGKCFLKKRTDVAVDSTNIVASGSPKSPEVGVRSKSRASGTVIPSAGLGLKSLRVVRGVSLESDEEDMRKLLGDSLDSTDNSLLRPVRPLSMRTAGKKSQKVRSTPPPAAVCPLSPSNTASPHSPASPSHHRSPFRFTDQAQAQFSPSVLSPSPSPPCVSPSPPRRLNSPHRLGSPQRSLSSMSGRSEVHSLEELFPVGPGSEDPSSEMSLVSSEDFKINVMTLDDLVPATFEFTEETPRNKRETKHSTPPGFPNRCQQLPRLREVEKEEDQQQEEEQVLDYQSDFESESRTEPNYSASQVSEHLQGDGDVAQVTSEMRDAASDSDVSREKTEDDYSSTFSDTASQMSHHSQTSKSCSRSSDSRSSVSCGSRTSVHQSKRPASARKVLKEAAVQTQPDTMAYTWSTGMATFEPLLSMTYMNPTPVVAHTLSAETVEALCNFNPAIFVLNEMLKQQLAMTRRFIESSRHLHSSLVQSLEPPNYRYTTLEDTKEYIHKHRSPKLTMEEALEEVLQEMRDSDHHCT